MRFGRTHAVLTTATGVFGIVALVGSVPLPGLSPLQILVELLVAAQIAAMALRRRGFVSSTDPFVFVLALVHMLLATFLGGGIAFVVAFVGLSISLPAALVLSHLRREVEANYQQGARDRTGSPVDVPRILRSRRVVDGGTLAGLAALAVPIILVTGIVFIASPRLALGGRAAWLSGLGAGSRPGLVHLTDTVDLSQRGELELDDAVALRFRVDGLAKQPAGARYTVEFRGAELDTFDGKSWSRSEAAGPPSSVALPSAPSPASTTWAITIEREPFEPSTFLVPVGTRAARIDDARTYVAFVATGDSSPRVEVLSAAQRMRLLALPRLSSRVERLAREWTAGAGTPLARARAIEGRLKGEFAYSLASSSRGQADPVDHFLFESKRGHCELHASAMAIMLRQSGIPSRTVTGLSGGIYNSIGEYFVVKQGDAHAWVEAFIEEPGAQASAPSGAWLTFDPTPTSMPAPAATGALATMKDVSDVVARRWGKDIVSYDDRSRGDIVSVLRRPAFVLGLASLLMCFALVRRSSFVGATARRVLRRITPGTGGGADPADPAAADRNAATALYAALEAALAGHGIVRDVAIPPLAYAQRLVSAHHPLAGEVAVFTKIYLEVRFGAGAFNEATRRELSAGVTRVLRWKSPSHSPAAGA